MKPMQKLLINSMVDKIDQLSIAEIEYLAAELLDVSEATAERLKNAITIAQQERDMKEIV